MKSKQIVIGILIILMLGIFASVVLATDDVIITEKAKKDKDCKHHNTDTKSHHCTKHFDMPFGTTSGMTGMVFPDFEDVCKEAGLDDKQIKILKEEKLNLEKKHIQIGAEIKVAKLELDELLDEENPNRNNVFKKVEAIGDLRTKLELAEMGWILKVKEITTEEQEQQLQWFIHRPHKQAMFLNGIGDMINDQMKNVQIIIKSLEDDGIMPDDIDIDVEIDGE